VCAASPSHAFEIPPFSLRHPACLLLFAAYRRLGVGFPALTRAAAPLVFPCLDPLAPDLESPSGDADKAALEAAAVAALATVAAAAPVEAVRSQVVRTLAACLGGALCTQL
jgi:hypothetical protein